MDTRNSSALMVTRRNVAAICLYLALAASLVLPMATTAGAANVIKTEVVVGKSAILTLPGAVSRVSVANPEVSDIVVISPREVQILGKKIGATSLIVWDKAGAKTFFDVDVVVDLKALKEQIGEIAPGDEINYKLINSQTLVLTGTVKTEERKTKIRNMLLGFGQDITETQLYILQGGVTKEVRGGGGGGGVEGFKFVLLLDVSDPLQVLLQITVASIDRKAERQLGINWAYVGKLTQVFSSAGSALPFTTITDFVQGAEAGGGELNFGNAPNFGILDGPTGTAWMIKALAGKGLAKILAEPNLIVKSGETGKFLAGGSFPIPIVTTATQGTFSPVTVEYKDFGVRLDFTPMVRESGLIQLKLDPAEVSSLDFANAVTLSGFRIPALKTDSVRTSVDLREGETFVIAGLIREDWSKNMQKFPILGDIPILGAFFREQQTSKTERDLVFIVTPKLMKPMAPGERVEIPGANEPTAAQEDDLRWIPMLPTYRSNDIEQLQ